VDLHQIAITLLMWMQTTSLHTIKCLQSLSHLLINVTVWF